MSLNITKQLTSAVESMSISHSGKPFYPLLSSKTQLRLQSTLDCFDDLSEDDCEEISLDIFDETLTPLYSKYLQIASPKITVCVSVLPDGFGDFGHALKTIQVIQKHFSSPVISLIAQIDDFTGKRKNLIESFVPAGLAHCVLDEIFDSSKSKKIKKILKESELVIQPAFDNPIDETTELDSNKLEILGFNIKNVGCLFYMEYGVEHDGPATGIDVRQKGIFFYDEILPRPFSEIQCIPLRTMLAGLDQSNDHAFFFGYLKNSHDLSLAFINLCCLCAKPSQKLIDIVIRCNIPEDYIINDGHHFFTSMLSDAGVETLIFYEWDDARQLSPAFKVNTLVKNGSLVRVINPFPLKIEDFDLLTRKSSFFTGCTGDISFSKCLPALPFYEIVSHKEPFFDSILSNVRTSFGEHSPLLEYFMTLKKLQEAAENLYDDEIMDCLLNLKLLLSNEKLHEEHQQFYNNLKQFHNLEDIMAAEMVKKLAQHRFPQFLTLEDSCFRSFEKHPRLLEDCAVEFSEELQKLAADADVQLAT